MNKIERLTGIMFILNRKKQVQARELAEIFEVSERTIYRDIQALSELKIPVIAETGIRGGYRIANDYFLQPIVLTEEECQAIFLGCNFIRQQKGFPFAKPAEIALEKLSSVFPEKNIAAAEGVLQKITYDLPVVAAASDLSPILSQIKEAMVNRKTIEIDYQALNKNEISTRKIDVYKLIFENDAWHILGFCHLRGEVRQFKVTRIKSLKTTNESFTLENWHETPGLTPKEPIIIKVEQGTKTAFKIKESHSYKKFIFREDSGYIYLHFPGAWFSPEHIIDITLGFGPSAEITSPASVREDFYKILNHLAVKYKRSEKSVLEDHKFNNS